MENIAKPRIYTVATAHLDTVWNWDLEQTVHEFLPNTFNGNFSLFEKYPEYTFNFEGAYRYKLIKEFYPEEYEKLKEYVKLGKWHPAGSAWENGDVIVTSPEGLFRNFLYGNLFFEKEFGKATNDIFLPDCFGFSQVLPAIGQHMGLKSFSTAKLIWSAGNFRPFDIGIWEGVNGQSIVAYLDPGQYMSNFDCEPGADENLLKYLSGLPVKKCLKYYGVGDMGGAPKESSASNVCNAVKDKELPVETVSSYASQMTDELTAEEYDKMPRYRGDLFMTTHAVGSYTSRCASKLLNRENELVADAAERFGVFADYLKVKKYPAAVFENAWKRVIQHQFHDDITGTSIQKVYEESFNDYFVSLNQFSHELASSAELIASNIKTDVQSGLPVSVFNSCGFKRKDVVEVVLPESVNVPASVCDEDGNLYPVQQISDFSGKRRIIFIADVPANGYRTYWLSDKKTAHRTKLNVMENELKNENYLIKIGESGDICGITDLKNNKEILKSGCELQLLENTYTEFGAWEILYSDLKNSPKAIVSDITEKEICESGPVRVSLKIKRRCAGSEFVQVISLCEGGEYVRVDNEVLWHEKSTLLKAAFPLNVSNEKAVCDIGLGRAVRPNSNEHNYEYPMQKWMSLSEKDGSYTVSVLNNCKYGMDKPSDNTLRMTLIHTPQNKWSDSARQDVQDFGKNIFSYAVSAGAGDWRQNRTPEMAEAFNKPLFSVLSDLHDGSLPCAYGLLSADTPQVEIKAVKKAERNNQYIVRVYEAYGKECRAALKFCRDITGAQEVTGYETFIRELEPSGGKLCFEMEPYEVKTFSVTLAESEYNVKAPAYKAVNIKNDLNCKISTDEYEKGKYGFGEMCVSLPESLAEGSFSSGGIDFEFSKSEDNTFGAVLCGGQTVNIPEGTKEIYIFGGSLDGEQTLDIEADGKKISVKVHCIFENIGCWDMEQLGIKGYLLHDTVAFSASHVHTNKGDSVYGKIYLFKYKAELPENCRSIRLPSNNKILIAGITAGNMRENSRFAKDIYVYPEENI